MLRTKENQRSMWIFGVWESMEEPVKRTEKKPLANQREPKMGGILKAK